MSSSRTGGVPLAPQEWQGLGLIGESCAHFLARSLHFPRAHATTFSPCCRGGFAGYNAYLIKLLGGECGLQPGLISDA
jgi:hypothetical protein